MLIASAVVLAMSSVAWSQKAPPKSDSAACAAILAAPTRDSVLKRVDLAVTALDDKQHAGGELLAYVAAAFRQTFRPPDRLTLSVYDVDDSADARSRHGKPCDASLTFRGMYRFVLRADGRIDDARMVSGTRDDALDLRVLATLDSIGAEQLIPAFGEAERNALHDSLAVQVSLDPASSVRDSLLHAAQGRLSLFAFRTPRRRKTQDAWPAAHNPGPRYPQPLLEVGLTGKADIEFVINSDGSPRPGSFKVRSATAPGFAAAALAVLPSDRFFPMFVDGCPVASLAVIPFQFDIRRP